MKYRLPICGEVWSDGRTLHTIVGIRPHSASGEPMVERTDTITGKHLSLRSLGWFLTVFNGGLKPRMELVCSPEQAAGLEPTAPTVRERMETWMMRGRHVNFESYSSSRRRAFEKTVRASLIMEAAQLLIAQAKART